MKNRKSVITIVSTALLLVAALSIKMFQINMASRVTIRPAAVEEQQVSKNLTEVEMKYVSEFVKQVQKTNNYEVDYYVTTRNVDSSVNIEVYFKDIDDVGHVTYDPVSDRWKGEMVVSE